MEYKVPQNIDVEDQIVGPLTLRQFVIFLIGSGFAFFFYVIFSSFAFPIFIFLTLIVAAACAGLAFVDYGGKHLETIILDALSSVGRPKRMVWRRDMGDVNAEVNKLSELEAAQANKSEIPVVVEKKDFNQIKDQLRAAASKADSQMAQVSFSGTEDELEKENPFLDNTITQGAQNVKRPEPLISEVASVNPSQKFEYPKIETNKNRFL